MLGDLVLGTGWTFEQAGRLTIPQLRAALAALNRRRKEQIEVMGGTVVEESKGKGQVEADMLERKLQMMKAKTGRTSFDLREII